MNRITRLGGRVAAAVTLIGLTGCEVHYTDLSGAQQAPQYRIWQAPTAGNFLCLAATPGTPIYAGAHGYGPVIGYTRNVVAFQGQQNGGWISVVSYNSPVIGWIDGTTIKPFQSVYPGHGCIVTVDAAQRPIFHIR